MTEVKFLVKESKKDGDYLFAYFPKEHNYHEQHPQYNEVFTSYAHVGQHSACHKDYAKRCRQATKEEYADLLAELKGQGYDDLVILNKDK